ncbi:hypothetical protein VTK73DRAFT_3138 [Phialemonium thermophilum]|uniref:FCP1 homology domain-containing protein n=1 Tax=Phialemonium thermophilum TaxID=223376 RepID=A0ABR3X1E3_9PEZI
MNSLNIISARMSPGSSPVPSRSNSLTALGLSVASEKDGEGEAEPSLAVSDSDTLIAEPDEFNSEKPIDEFIPGADESTPLLAHDDSTNLGSRSSAWHLIPRRIATTFINSIRWILSTLAAPGVYLIACLCDEDGNFAPLVQLKKSFGHDRGRRRKLAADYDDSMIAVDEKTGMRGATFGFGSRGTSHTRASRSSGSSSSGVSSDSESGQGENSGSGRSSKHSRSKSLQEGEVISPNRRSIKIRLHADDPSAPKTHRKTQSANPRGSTTSSGTSDISAQLKSPTSPAGALTKYPKTPAPPRPLVPRRQPSYLNTEPLERKQQKTLILDLDETLIHSMSKGGRMSTGHMVEVRLNTTYVGVGGQATIGPQHPILYYVHKRPHCDDFLRRVCKWYNLVIFTASVQEYADPVIDWLESERKFFSARYYRQHCTFRHGAFIKDLSSVEPDLSKVMILDNSPLSYMFHQDNAIPIQGWINDPTDNDLLHLIPLLEGLQYVSDVRALLALRGGEDGQHMA